MFLRQKHVVNSLMKLAPDVLAFRENRGLIFCLTLECRYKNVRLPVLSVEMF